MNGKTCSRMKGCLWIAHVLCLALGGSCGDDRKTNPLPEGPCCFASGACLIMTEAGCLDDDGGWLGIGTACDPNPCPLPEGACCLAGGACLLMPEAGCLTEGGRWLGIGTACDPNPCPQPRDGFALLQPGTFTMGSPPDEPGRWEDENQRQVTITRPFYMAVVPVTEELWDEVMGSGSSTSQLPKVYVNWSEAVDFCNRLSILDGLQTAYVMCCGGMILWIPNANGYRLPTEAEWEYACRAGTTTAFNNNTNCLCSDTEANYNGEYPLQGCRRGIYRGARTDVGSFPPNPWGLYDMHGSVFEWCWDVYVAYGGGHVIDPAGPASRNSRVVRGGSYAYHAQYCRSAFRYGYWGLSRAGYIGLRVARTAG